MRHKYRAVRSARFENQWYIQRRRFWRWRDIDTVRGEDKAREALARYERPEAIYAGDVPAANGTEHHE